jgi:hypothetical protein
MPVVGCACCSTPRPTPRRWWVSELEEVGEDLAHLGECLRADVADRVGEPSRPRSRGRAGTAPRRQPRARCPDQARWSPRSGSHGWSRSVARPGPRSGAGRGPAARSRPRPGVRSRPPAPAARPDLRAGRHRSGASSHSASSPASGAASCSPISFCRRARSAAAATSSMVAATLGLAAEAVVGAVGDPEHLGCSHDGSIRKRRRVARAGLEVRHRRPGPDSAGLPCRSRRNAGMTTRDNS